MRILQLILLPLLINCLPVKPMTEIDQLKTNMNSLISQAGSYLTEYNQECLENSFNARDDLTSLEVGSTILPGLRQTIARAVITCGEMGWTVK